MTISIKLFNVEIFAAVLKIVILLATETVDINKLGNITIENDPMIQSILIAEYTNAAICRFLWMFF